MEKDPLCYVCPECKAAINARCTRKKRDGCEFIDEPHQARVDVAMADASAFQEKIA